MPMAEGKRGRRVPAGRSAQSKLLQNGKISHNVLHVNLDVRSGVPRATVVNPKQQKQQSRQQQVFKGDSKPGVVGGIPLFNHGHKPRGTSSHRQQQENPQNYKNNINNSSFLAGVNIHKSTPKSTAKSSSSTAYYRETLDEPPKYDEIFKSQVYHGQHQQSTQRTCEKKPLKSYILKHFPKAKTFNKLNINHRTFTPSTLSGTGSGGREGCYAEIHIPVPSGNQLPHLGEFGSSSPTSTSSSSSPEEIEGVTQACPPEVEIHHFESSLPKEGQPAGDRKYTINLKPGHYRINVQWRSKTHPFRIALTPNRTNGEGLAPPPSDEQPLYYGSCEAHQQFVNQDTNTSFPRRLVHRLLFRQHSSPPLECSYSTGQGDHNINQEDHHHIPSMASQQPHFQSLPHQNLPKNLQQIQLQQQQLLEQHQQQQSQQLNRLSPSQPYVAPHVQLQKEVAQQQHQLLQQHVGMNPAAGGDRKGQKRCWEGGPRHRQRKSRYRWASLSCMHLNSLDESIGEASGADSSYGGYEGVEHLKRHSLSQLKAVSAESLSCGWQGSSTRPFRVTRMGRLAVGGGARVNVAMGKNSILSGDGINNHNVRRVNSLNDTNVSRSGNIKYGVSALGSQSSCSNNVLSGVLDDVDEREGMTDDSFVFIEKPQMKYHVVSGENAQRTDISLGDYIAPLKKIPIAGERKTWHEDEAFIKQVVDEYFKDPVSLSDVEDKELCENSDIPDKVKVTTPDPSVGIAPKAQVESDLSSTSSDSSSESNSSYTSLSSEDDHEFLENELLCASPSIDDATYCEDSDDTNSWYTDDSLGYEADVEPSDKDTLGHIWRRWKSAPDMRQASEKKMRRMHQLGKLAGVAAAAAVESLGPQNLDSSAINHFKCDKDLYNVTDNNDKATKDWEGAHYTQGPPSVWSSYNPVPLCGYKPRKSCSVDETKLSRLKIGVKKVKKHKLIQFNQIDTGRKTKAALLVSSNKAATNYCNSNEKIYSMTENIPGHKMSSILSPQFEADDDEFDCNEKLEFVNGKYKAGVSTEDLNRHKDIEMFRCLHQERKQVGGDLGLGTVEVGVVERNGGGGGGDESVCGTSFDGGSVDDSTTERTERVLTQGLVVHHSKADYDPHSILKPSVIKNALSILREGITTDLEEVPKFVAPRDEKGMGEEGICVPNKSVQKSHSIIGENNISLDINEDVKDSAGIRKGNFVNYDDGCLRDVETGSFSESLSEKLKSELDNGFVNSNISLDELEDMNKSKITIHLTPPNSRRESHSVPRKQLEPLKSTYECSLNRPLICGKSNLSVNEYDGSANGPIDGCFPRFDNDTRGERTYENVDNEGRPSVGVFHQISNKSVGKEGKGGRYNNLNVSNVSLKNDRDPNHQSKRSISVDSLSRRDQISLSRASAVSSSSETSGCCHGKSKPKSKQHKSQRMSGNDSCSTSASNHQYTEEGNQGQGSTTSASNHVLDDEYHVQRIQVGTGNNRKFAQAIQRAVIEVPVSGKETMNNDQNNRLQRSELVLEPMQSRGSTLKSSSLVKQPKNAPTFASASFPKGNRVHEQQNCISEYNMGDSQANRRTPDSYGPFEEKMLKSKSESLTSTSSFSSKHQKDSDGGKKSKRNVKGKNKSTPIKYFSGILNAFGNAAPKFRTGSTDREVRDERNGMKPYDEMNNSIERSRYDIQRKKQKQKSLSDFSSTVFDTPLQNKFISKPSNSDYEMKDSIAHSLTRLSEGGDEALGGTGTNCERSLPPSTKSDRLQVRDTKNKYPTGSGESRTPSVNETVVPPVPSPRPKRALKNSSESAGNIAPTPPTRRKNFSEIPTQHLSNDPIHEKRRGGREGERHTTLTTSNANPTCMPSNERNNGIQTDKISKLQQSSKNSKCLVFENSNLKNQSSVFHMTSPSHSSPMTSPPSHKSTMISPTSHNNVDCVEYENIRFHEKHTFGHKKNKEKNHRRQTLVESLNSDSGSGTKMTLNDTDSHPHKKNNRKTIKDKDKKNKCDKSKSNHRSISLKHSYTNEIPSTLFVPNNECSVGSNTCSGGGAAEGGGSGGSGGGGGSGGVNGNSNSQGYCGGSRGKMEGNRNSSKEGLPGGGSGIGGGSGGGGWRSSGGGHNPGGSGGESSGGASGRRRRIRPPTLPTSPMQSSRPRRHSQTSQTSGGSLPSSPTRWRRPQFEDTWDGLSDDGGGGGGGYKDYRRISRTPSAESMESEATSFYYSAMGSTVCDDPKSVYEEASARYSFVTCPQYEAPERHISSAQLTPGKSFSPGANIFSSSSNSKTNIPNTISGDLNCDVDVSLSEGEIKVRVRTEDDEVTSSTPIHEDDSDSDDGNSESDDECDSEDSDSHEYDISRSLKSPDVMYSSSETEVDDGDDDDDDDDEEGDETVDNEIKVIGTGVVHAIPCMAGTDSSNWSSLSSSCDKGHHGPEEITKHLSKSTKRESGLVHATPCWATTTTTESDRRSSVSSTTTEYYSKVCLSASTEQKIYEPRYENISPTCIGNQGSERSVSSECDTQKRRLSGVWTTQEESDDDSSEWEDETLPVNLQQSFSKVSIAEGEDDDVDDDNVVNHHPPEGVYPEDETSRPDFGSSSMNQDDPRNNCVSPLYPSPPPFPHQGNWHTDPTAASSCMGGFPGVSPPAGEWGDSQQQEQHANAWELHRAMWEHHQKIHDQHLHHLHHHHQQHQSLLADVMSCIGGGTRWGRSASNWCHHAYSDNPTCGIDETRYPHLQDSPTPDCRWSGQFQDDPPYQPAGATSPGDLGKPPPSPLPPSGSHRSRDTSSVPRDSARPQSRQRSRSRRRAHSANSKYRVELELSPHVLTKQRPSSFSSLAARRHSDHSPEPLEDDLHQEALLYLAETTFDHTADANRRRLAERKKNEGNELYKAKDYREALKLYTQAIDLCPDCAAYYSNRSACYMMLGKYHDALNDAREAVRLDTSFVKGYIRVAKCNIALGDANAALSVLRQAGELEPANRSIRDEMNNAQALLRCLDEVTKATAKEDYRTAIFHLDRALDQAVGCRNLKITKAEYLVFLSRFADAQEMVNEILQFDSGNADAIYVRGMCLYYQDNPEAAFNHFQHVLRLAPDHQKARDIYKKAKVLKIKKEEGNDAFKRGSFQEAHNLYTEALAIDPLNKNTNAKLYFNRATVGSKLNKLEEAVDDCTAAINLDEGYVKAYLRRAKCYQTLEKHEEAVRDYEKVTRLDRNQEHKRLLHEAKIQLKRSKRKDYYKILGVGKTATDDEIKKSYRKMALVHHPDRHANGSEKDKREHEVKFKEIGEAYAVLTDAKKRAMYDRGQDINDPDGGFGHDADIDPNQIFQAFFGGHGGHGFGGHSSFQQGGFPGGGFGGGSFPGGFHFQFG